MLDLSHQSGRTRLLVAVGRGGLRKCTGRGTSALLSDPQPLLQGFSDVTCALVTWTLVHVHQLSQGPDRAGGCVLLSSGDFGAADSYPEGSHSQPSRAFSDNK